MRAMIFLGPLLVALATLSACPADQPNQSTAILGRHALNAGPDPKPRLFAQLGHFHTVSAGTLSDNGRWVVTGSYDKTARLWELSTARDAQISRAHG